MRDEIEQMDVNLVRFNIKIEASDFVQNIKRYSKDIESHKDIGDEKKTKKNSNKSNRVNFKVFKYFIYFAFIYILCYQT